jgi:hypothetical protein
LCLLASTLAVASSHREAPLITHTPKLDCTDFYLFNSYEPGREGYVTMVANYLPLQPAYGGPNYFQLDPNAVYEIHVDNNGDAVEDLTFQFRFTNTSRDIALPIGPPGNQRTNAVPVLAVGQITAGNNAALNVDQNYTITLIRGARRTGATGPIVQSGNGSAVFTKPQDYVGTKTFPAYDAYANAYIYDIDMPGTARKGRVFVGQRKDPFVVNLGETFDLINISTSPLGPENANKDSLEDDNVTSIVLEVPKEVLLSAADKPIVGAWSTCSTVKPDGAGGRTFTQVSRLSMPLVNEVVIGVKDKDKFNASEPKDDGQFLDYVTHPTLPAIIELLYGAAGAKAPTQFPRTDLVAAFLTGLDGLNKNGSVGEMQRLNTSTPPLPRDQQKSMAALAGDTAGFPNGRRPGDDVVDIALRVVMGALLPADQAPAGKLPFTDGAAISAMMFQNKFPYLQSPLPGSPNEPSISIVPQTAAAVDGPYKNTTGAYDPATRRLAVPKPDGAGGFLRLKSNGRVSLDDVSATPGELNATVNTLK